MVETEADFTQFRASLEATRARAHELRVVSLAIQQRLAETRQDLLDALDRARATCDAVRQQLASLRPGSAQQNGSQSEPSNAVVEALSILGLGESDLDEVTDDLIAAFKAASAVGDDDGRTLFGNALMLIGRHLATQVSPKDAGVIMN